MSNIIRKSDEQFSLKSFNGFAHKWVETESHIYDFDREAVEERPTRESPKGGGISLDQLRDDEILLAPGVIYRLRKDGTNDQR